VEDLPAKNVTNLIKQLIGGRGGEVGVDDTHARFNWKGEKKKEVHFLFKTGKKGGKKIALFINEWKGLNGMGKSKCSRNQYALALLGLELLMQAHR